MEHQSPNLSVVIPVYQDPRGLQATLASLAEQDLPPEQYEVVVVDNGSGDDTPDVARAGVAALPCASRLLIETRSGSYAARKTGVEHTQSGLLMFIDADMTLPRDALSRVVAQAQHTGFDYAGCAVQIEVPAKPTLAAIHNAASGFPIEHYLRERHFAPTCCLVVKREWYEKVGGFDPRVESGGDMLFGNRCHDAGAQQVFLKEVTLRHPARTSWTQLAAKARRVGRGIAQLTHHHDGYDELTRRLRCPRRWRPRRPDRIMRQCRAAGFAVSALQACVISGRGVWLRRLAARAWRREKARLEAQAEA